MNHDDLYRWRRATYLLYRLLDNIDTYDDMCGDDDSKFRELARIMNKLRWTVLNDDEADDLYKQFWGTDDFALGKSEISIPDYS